MPPVPTQPYDTDLKDLIKNQVIAKTLGEYVKSNPLFETMMSSEAVDLKNQVDRGFENNQTVLIKVKPYLPGQRLANGSATFTKNALTYGQEAVTLTNIIGESIEIDAQRNEAIMAGDMDTASEVLDTLVPAVLDIKLRTDINALRTTPDFTTVGTFGTAITRADLLKIQKSFLSKNYDQNLPINVVCNFNAFHQIAELASGNDKQDLRMFGEVTSTYISLVGAVNMRFFVNNEYTEQVNNTTPLMTVFGESTVLNPIRAPKIQDALSQKILSVNKYSFLLDVDLVPDGRGNKNKTWTLSALQGNKNIQPMKNVLTTGNKFWGLHVMGGNIA